MKDWLNFIPLAAFLMIGYSGEESISKWTITWKISSVLAVFAFALNAFKLNSSNRIFLGVNLFLIIGGILSWLHLGEWLAIYGGLFRGVSAFVIISIVGIISTLYSRRGYINVGSGRNVDVTKYSWILVGVTIFAGTISWVFRGNQFLEGTLPFAILYIASVVLAKKVVQ